MYTLSSKYGLINILYKTCRSSVCKLPKSGLRTRQKNAFGIDEVSEDDVSGSVVGANIEKFKYLTRSKVAKDNEEKYVITSFGSVRYDKLNQPQYHGQFESENDGSYLQEEGLSTESAEAADSPVVDTEEVLRETGVKQQQQQLKDLSSDVQQPASVKGKPKGVFFDDEEEDDVHVLDLAQISPSAESQKLFQRGKYHFNATKEWKAELKKRPESVLPPDPMSEAQTAFNIAAGIKLGKESPLKDFSSFEKEMQEMKLEEMEEMNLEEVQAAEEKAEEAEVLSSAVDNKSGEAESKTTTNIEDLEINTPYDYYKHLKAGVLKPATARLREKLDIKLPDMDLTNPEETTLDSQGFRNYKEQLNPYATMTKEDIAWMLKKRVLLDEKDILAIDKPYGLVCHGDPASAKAPVLHDLFPQLCKLLKTEKLYPVHRLDKEVTGVLLLAKTQAMANTLMSMFRARKIKKYYSAILRGVPDQPEGVIDIPMEVGRIDDKERMVLKPHLEESLRRLGKPSRNAKRAVTHYKVKFSRGNAALVDIEAETGIKHQIRCHLGFGLRTPILGDHKYSYLDRLAPQKLPADMLLALNVRQAKVRNIPLHLHCKVVEIPDLGRDGGPIFIKAHLPRFFKANARALKLFDD